MIHGPTHLRLRVACDFTLQYFQFIQNPDELFTECRNPALNTWCLLTKPDITDGISGYLSCASLWLTGFAMSMS